MNGHHGKPSTDLPMSYSRLSLESAANAIQQPIRHHPNGLVTFNPNNGHNGNGHNHTNGSMNGNVSNGHVNGDGSITAHGNGHVGNGHTGNNGHVSNGHIHHSSHSSNGHGNGHVTGHGGGAGANGRVHHHRNQNGTKSDRNHADDAPQHNINHHVHQLKPRSDPNQVIVIV